MLALSFASLGYAAPHDDTPALVLFTAEQMQRTGAARAMGCRESDFRADDDDVSMVSSASRSGRKVKRKSERRALVDKGAPKTYGKRAAPASRSKGEGFYEL